MNTRQAWRAWAFEFQDLGMFDAAARSFRMAAEFFSPIRDLTWLNCLSLGAANFIRDDDYANAVPLLLEGLNFEGNNLVPVNQMATHHYDMFADLVESIEHLNMGNNGAALLEDMFWRIGGRFNPFQVGICAYAVGRAWRREHNNLMEIVYGEVACFSFLNSEEEEAIRLFYNLRSALRLSSNVTGIPTYRFF